MVTLEDIANENLKDPNFLVRTFGRKTIKYSEAMTIIKKEYSSSCNAFISKKDYIKRWFKLAELHGLSIGTGIEMSELSYAISEAHLALEEVDNFDVDSNNRESIEEFKKLENIHKAAIGKVIRLCLLINREQKQALEIT